MIPTHGIDLTTSFSLAPVLLVMLASTLVLLHGALACRPRRRTPRRRYPFRFRDVWRRRVRPAGAFR